jgi:hypothetical protein
MQHGAPQEHRETKKHRESPTPDEVYDLYLVTGLQDRVAMLRSRHDLSIALHGDRAFVQPQVGDQL